MRVLHTSDWHLGRSLYGRKRYDEFTAFLDWLIETIQREKVDVLLVAGDIFDTNTPSNRAQELYYGFLCRVATVGCRHVLVIAGNHDSASFLNAPKELLRALHVYVVGALTEDIADEVFVLEQEDGQAEAIVCAVPYLRDKDIRTVEAGETIDDKNRKLVAGIQAHYHAVVAYAEEKRAQLQTQVQGQAQPIPIIAMGHLFTAGGKTLEGDGVRELYVGSLAHVSEAIFPAAIDYLALGHLHVPQAVGGAEHMRYSGSPIPMGYGEAKQGKSVVLLVFNPTEAQSSKPAEIRLLPVPCFQVLERIVGELDVILERVQVLNHENSQAWLEIEYTGRAIISDLRQQLDAALLDSTMEIRRIKNKRIVDQVIQAANVEETLDDLNAGDVFKRCLDSKAIPEEERGSLLAAYNEILQNIQEEDSHAE